MTVLLNRSGITKIQAVIVIVIVVLAAVGSIAFLTRPSTPPAPLVVLKVSEGVDFSTLDPADAYSSNDVAFVNTAYNKLLRYERANNSMNIVPDLAQSWTVSPDGTTFTFNLRHGVMFHDGTTLNASYVKYSYERVKALGLGPSYITAYWKEINVLDPYTVQIVLNATYAPFQYALASDWLGMWIVSPNCVQAHAMSNDTWAHGWMLEHECGSGAYMLDHWTHNQEAVFNKFPGYWEGWAGPHIDQVVFIVGITEPATRRLMMESGDVDIIPDNGLAPSDKISLSKEAGILLEVKPSLDNMYIFFNYQKAPTNNVLVRRAISYAFNYTPIASDIMEGFANQAQGPLPMTLPMHDNNLFVYEKNQAKAEQLLDEAGYPVGKAGPGLRMELKILYWTGDEVQRKTSEFLQSELAQIGIKLDITNALYGTIMNDVHGPPAQGPDMVYLYWYPDFADPDTYFRSQFMTGVSWNMGFYDNATMDAMINAAATQPNQAMRAQEYAVIQTIMVQDAWGLYLIDLASSVCIRSWVHNYYYNPIYEDQWDFWYMYIQK